jgi:hypothetical protein
MSAGEILLYQTEDGRSRIDVRLVNDTIWLSAGQMADLFQRDKSVILKHIKNVFAEGELVAGATVANFATVQTEGAREVTRDLEHFNLDVVISVGYRVKSHRGVQFRQWATRQLRDYLVKGFVLNDEKFKQGGASNYFDLLLQRIRDIRSSEKEFWRKVLEIYATSIDYDPSAEASRKFFATIQNTARRDSAFRWAKPLRRARRRRDNMHWAAHGQTAAEVVHRRADASQPNMGLTSWPAGQLAPRRADVAVAKNYLSAEELDTFNRLVTIYLDFAELQARDRKPMYMADWLRKLDQFLQISEREILTHAGSISADAAREKAEAEYDQFRRLLDTQPSAAETHLRDAIEVTKRLETEVKSGKRRSKPATDQAGEEVGG